MFSAGRLFFCPCPCSCVSPPHYFLSLDIARSFLAMVAHPCCHFVAAPDSVVHSYRGCILLTAVHHPRRLCYYQLPQPMACPPWEGPSRPTHVRVAEEDLHAPSASLTRERNLERRQGDSATTGRMDLCRECCVVWFRSLKPCVSTRLSVMSLLSWSNVYRRTGVDETSFSITSSQLRSRVSRVYRAASRSDSSQPATLPNARGCETQKLE